jgi:hypothetical protein
MIINPEFYGKDCQPNFGPKWALTVILLLACMLAVGFYIQFNF